MSSGVVRTNYNFATTDLPIQSLFKLDKNQGQKCKFNFISELVLLFFSHKNYKDSYKYFSTLINLSLQIPEKKFADVIFSGNNALRYDDKDNSEFLLAEKSCFDKKNYLLMLNRIRSILNSCPDLTYEQKFDYCSIERYFMKLYLKECIVGI